MRSWLGAFGRARGFVAAALATALAVGPAAATSPEVGIGFQRFTASGPHDVLGRGISDMLDTDMVNLLYEAGNRDCRLAVREVKRIDDIMKELELQKSPAFDPKTRVKPNFIELRYDAVGQVSSTETSLTVDIKITDTRTGKVEASFNETFAPDDVLEAVDKAVKSLLDQLCPRKHRLQLSVGPYFVIDTEVCGIAKPFQARPKGEFGGVLVRFTPSSREAGSFTEGGRAYGAQWNGSGNYTIAWTGDQGRFVASNPNTATSKAGKSNNADTMTGTVTRLATRCRSD